MDRIENVIVKKSYPLPSLWPHRGMADWSDVGVIAEVHDGAELHQGEVVVHGAAVVRGVCDDTGELKSRDGTDLHSFSHTF